MVRMLCNVWEAFSARHSARKSGRKKCIAAGASEPGAIWNTIRTPSTTSSCPVAAMSRVGRMRVTGPDEVVCPRAAGRRGLGEDVLRARGLDEARRRQDRDPPRVDVLLRGHTLHAAEVVHV